MLWQRRLFEKQIKDEQEIWCSHFSGDSSPQAGYDHMVFVEDRFVFSKDPNEVVRLFLEHGKGKGHSGRLQKVPARGMIIEIHVAGK